MLGLTAKAGAGEVTSGLSLLPSHCPGGSTERVPGLVTEGLSPRQRSSGNGIVMAPEPGSDGKEEVNNVQDRVGPTGPTGCLCGGSRMGRWIRLEAAAVEWGGGGDVESLSEVAQTGTLAEGGAWPWEPDSAVTHFILWRSDS